MIKKIKYFALWAIALGLFSVAHGQNTYQFGALPNFNLHHQFSSGWSIDYKLELRQRFAHGFYQDENKLNYSSVFTDNSIYLSHKIGNKVKLGVGYMARFHEGLLIHRSLQVMSFKQNLSKINLSHQLIMDQTFFQDDTPFYRWRYRLGLVVPLGKIKSHTSDWYFKFTNEYSFWIRLNKPAMEIRLIPMIGKQINTHNKLEWGMDYRAFGLVNGSTDHRYWLTVSWHVSIPQN